MSNENLIDGFLHLAYNVLGGENDNKSPVYDPVNKPYIESLIKDGDTDKLEGYLLDINVSPNDKVVIVNDLLFNRQYALLLELSDRSNKSIEEEGGVSLYGVATANRLNLLRQSVINNLSSQNRIAKFRNKLDGSRSNRPHVIRDTARSLDFTLSYEQRKEAVNNLVKKSNFSFLRVTLSQKKYDGKLARYVGSILDIRSASLSSDDRFKSLERLLGLDGKNVLQLLYNQGNLLSDLAFKVERILGISWEQRVLQKEVFISNYPYSGFQPWSMDTRYNYHFKP
jgi:hypothetical protein